MCLDRYTSPQEGLPLRLLKDGLDKLQYVEVEGVSENGLS
jgi:hypothetical protein